MFECVAVASDPAPSALTVGKDSPGAEGWNQPGARTNFHCANFQDSWAKPSQSPRGRRMSVFFQDFPKRTVNLHSAVVLNEAQPAEFVHEKIDALPPCSHHLRQVYRFVQGECIPPEDLMGCVRGVLSNGYRQE